MEQIARRDGVYHYGDIPCLNADEAYRLFRNDYHASLGKRVYRRLDARAREERVHGFHVYYTDEYQKALDDEFGKMMEGVQVPCHILGISGISYCYAINGNDCPNLEEEQHYRWLDWALSHYGTAIKLKGRKSGMGRTSKRIKTKYR